MKRRDFLKFWPALAATSLLPAGADADEVVLPPLVLSDRMLIGVDMAASESDTIVSLYYGSIRLIHTRVWQGLATRYGMLDSLPYIPTLSRGNELRLVSDMPAIAICRLAPRSARTITDIIEAPIETVMLACDGTPA